VGLVRNIQVLYMSIHYTLEYNVVHFAALHYGFYCPMKRKNLSEDIS
jgi:hypothetical protein